MTELGDQLGPLLWQFAPTKKFDEADFGNFLELLPETLDGRALRHVVEVRHDSFRTPDFIALLRKFEIAGRVRRARHISDDRRRHRRFRLCAAAEGQGRRSRPAIRRSSSTPGPSGLQTWAQGGEPDDLPRVDAKHKPKEAPRDVFAYVIHEGKVRAPAARWS